MKGSRSQIYEGQGHNFMSLKIVM